MDKTFFAAVRLKLRNVLGALTSSRSRNDGRDREAWRVHCGETGQARAAALLVLRFICHVVIYAYAAAGFVLFASGGVDWDTLAMPFYYLWTREPSFAILVIVGAVSACGRYVYSRVGAKAVNSDWQQSRSSKELQK